MDYDSIKKWLSDLNLTMPQVSVAAIVIVIIGLVILSFTFIVPILAIGAALALIVGAVLVIYKFLGGK
jgi:uncharacterized membrane protein YdfJ with MMPL/SSD domain